VIREAYNQGVAQAVLEKVGALVDLSDSPEPGDSSNTLGLLTGAGIGGAAILGRKSLQGFLHGALARGRTLKSRALWGGLGALGALGLGGYLGRKALEDK